jgi:hypothetical protein
LVTFGGETPEPPRTAESNVRTHLNINIENIETKRNQLTKKVRIVTPPTSQSPIPTPYDEVATFRCIEESREPSLRISPHPALDSKQKII